MTPSVKAAERAQAAAYARSLLGSEAAGEPIELMLQAVRLSAGQTAYYRALMEVEGDVAPHVVDGYERALERQARIVKAALDAGVAERMVRIAERFAETISLAAEDALAAMMVRLGLSLSPAERAQFAVDFQKGLARLEQPAVEGTAQDR